MIDSSKRTTILYIAYYFPPLGMIASHRSLKMVKYLEQCGIDCVVLTLSPKGMRQPLDKELLSEVPSSASIYRFYCFDPSWIFKVLWGLKLHSLVSWLKHRYLIPDEFVFGLNSARRMLSGIFNKHDNISCAIISGGPFSSYLLGLTLKARYKVPFICDWRDEWTNNPERINTSFPASTQRKELLLEARVLAAASANVYLTGYMRANFLQKYPILTSRPDRIIPNGFDDNDFTKLTPVNSSGHMRLLYTGSFYDRRQPDRLWTAITELIDEGLIDPTWFKVDIMGRNTPRFVLGKHYHDPLIRSLVSFTPFSTHAESIREMYSSTALLLYIPSGENTASVLTGKLFEYLRSGKPVLAIIPSEGQAAEYLRKAGTGFIADYDDPDGIKATLLDLVSKWRSNMLKDVIPDQDFIAQFSRQKQAEVLAELIRDVITVKT